MMDIGIHKVKLYFLILTFGDSRSASYHRETSYAGGANQTPHDFVFRLFCYRYRMLLGVQN